MTGSAGGPSLRTRLVRRVFVVALRALRELGAGGPPEPDAPVAELEAYALRLRTASERVLSMVPLGCDVEVAPLDGAPVAGRVVSVPEAGAVSEELIGSVRWLAAAPRVVLHLHGGAYVMGSSRTHRGLGAALARAGRAVVVLPDYRLVPEHAYPAALDDAEATWRWLTTECGVAPERIALTGDSAGGGLAAALLVRLRDLGAPLPACYVGLSPWLDLAGTGRSMVEMASVDPWLSAALVRPAASAYAGAAPLDHPEVSPLYADLAGLPPMLLHVGSDEILRDDALRFAEKARAAGVDASAGVFPGLWHVFQAFPGLPEGQAALAEVGGFIRRHTVAGRRSPQGVAV